GGRLLKRGEPVRLRRKAWEVLCYLAERPSLLVSTDKLLADVWCGVAVTGQVATNVIRELRVALGEDARSARWIETVHGRGYRFVGEEERAAGSGAVAEAFVGRAGELAALVDRWHRAAAGTRQIVFLTGEPGIGKSTLLAALIEAVRNDGASDGLIAR